MKKITINFILIAISLLIGWGVAFYFKPEETKRITQIPIDKMSELRGINSVISLHPFSEMGTTSPEIVIVGTTGGDNQQIFATNTDAIYRAISNDCSSQIYLTFDDVPTYNTLPVGIRLNANGGTWEQEGDKIYVGTIRATSSALCSVTAVEATR